MSKLIDTILRRSRQGFICLIILLAACSRSGNPTPLLTPITLQLKYLHQAQFAGFYSAEQNGYYADEGLKITFIEGGATVDLEKAVLDGTAQFGVTGAENLIAARADGEPLRAIAVIYRRNPVVFMSLADSGITRPQDIVGKTVQYNVTTSLMLNAMLANLGISPDQYSEVDVGSDLDQFYSGQVQIWNAFLINEVLMAQENGYQVNIIYPDDYGIHFYSDTLYATDDTISTNPDLVLRFLRATIKGWTFATQNPNAAAALVANYNLNADMHHESAMMTASIPLINTGEDFIGWMRPEIWVGMEQIMRQQDVLTHELDPTEVYTMQFLEAIYK